MKPFLQLYRGYRFHLFHLLKKIHFQKQTKKEENYKCNIYTWLCVTLNDAKHCWPQKFNSRTN